MLIKFYTYTNATEAGLALARLQNEGVQAMLRNETIHGILPVQALAIQLWVNEEDLDVARQILHTEPIGDQEMPEDFREIDHKEIDYLRKQHKRKGWMPWIWALIGLLILLLLIIGW
ncbi:MAG: DUF2007 domain-containing protein [Saprospiraceae bacterium]|nr:DUF2007 domain-containing protein [Saprospiraceae bacterium]